MRRYFFPTPDSRSSTPAPSTPLGSNTPKPGTPLNLQEYLLSNTPDGAVSGPSGTFSHLGRAYYGLDEEGFSDDSRDLVVHRAEVRLHGGMTAPLIQCSILMLGQGLVFVFPSCQHVAVVMVSCDASHKRTIVMPLETHASRNFAYVAFLMFFEFTLT